VPGSAGRSPDSGGGRGRDAAGAGFLLLSVNLGCAAIGAGIGALVGALVPLLIVGFFVGFGVGLRVVVKRFSQL
jgi:hypothetical protein